MKVKRNAAYDAFLSIPDGESWTGTRLKDVRAQTLSPGGRVALTMFESVDGGRPHPRMQTAMPPARDPSPPDALYRPPERAPASAKAARAHFEDALADAADVLDALDLAADAGPEGSPRYFRLSVRAQRIGQFFAEARAAVASWLESGALAADEEDGAERALRELAHETYAGDLKFDDADTGTYHSYGHDAPFVHYLERLIASLPVEGGEGFAALPAEAQHSIRRQREQLRAHLDHLMRHKYAYEVIAETDIERTLGGFLIDRDTRLIASEVPDEESLVPRFELLRIDPGADHEHKGEYVYRDAAGALYLQDHAPVEVAAGALRSTPLAPAQITFRRAPRDRHLRRGIRFDWDDSGWVRAGKIDWVSWAGHCDIKAIMEQLGITLTGGRPDEPSVSEYRSDTGETQRYDRDLVLEMIASAMEFGSRYRRADGSGYIVRGIHRFGGARNDSRPDRLQFQGPGPGRSFRWPLSGRQEEFRVASIAWDGERADMGMVFYRYRPDLDAVKFQPNPRFLETIEGDYNLIDVSGAVMEADVLVDVFDEQTGYPDQDQQRVTIDLSPEARGGERQFLGTHIDDVATRRMYRVYLDRARGVIVAEMERYEQRDGKWRAVPVPEDTVELPLTLPLTCTLSREMKRDDPESAQTVLDRALMHAENICADTDMKAEVWNGVVTRLNIQKVADNPGERTQRWRIDVEARFGTAQLDFLVRRDERGVPVEFCPAPTDDDESRWPDFFWQDFPDVGSKGFEGADWIVNEAMVDRGVVTVKVERSVPGGFYVYDDHIKNLYELIYAALAGYRYTIVHANKRHGFTDEDAWKQAIDAIEAARAELTFE